MSRRNGRRVFIAQLGSGVSSRSTASQNSSCADSCYHHLSFCSRLFHTLPLALHLQALTALPTSFLACYSATFCKSKVDDDIVQGGKNLRSRAPRKKCTVPAVQLTGRNFFLLLFELKLIFTSGSSLAPHHESRPAFFLPVGVFFSGFVAFSRLSLGRFISVAMSSLFHQEHSTLCERAESTTVPVETCYSPQRTAPAVEKLDDIYRVHFRGIS